jgi:hypothetical protein
MRHNTFVIAGRCKLVFILQHKQKKGAPDHRDAQSADLEYLLAVQNDIQTFAFFFLVDPQTDKRLRYHQQD